MPPVKRGVGDGWHREHIPGLATIFLCSLFCLYLRVGPDTWSILLVVAQAGRSLRSAGRQEPPHLTHCVNESHLTFLFFFFVVYII